ncbi:type II toxin-antitoxin system RelE/ParE family toxin [Geomonas propionica]|uniref:Type II toxin-antitoxin system RelE/ParE family toxin n=1 Tax=Geomonas propionica TaxID=2798582 RepID=A0ABS0YXB7_9BACT|nr:type II toxin-antitoxin system RelE/ParE family toxin [Geomonas propionica]MBJ6802382.1 type II toxin-antitoxin system RelE/ParE family toxin [Geomonas propionica]
MMLRVFKNKWFSRWARREGIADGVLLDAAKEIASGNVEADLGGYLFKKRIARAGGGKSGGYRTIVGYKSTSPSPKRIIFLYAFAKNAKTNISVKEEAALSLVAGSFLSAPDSKIDEYLLKGSIVEVKADERDS